ncbi:MAG: polyprenyl synthetase family protein [Defluviitaleaceae bacterium]|nr:polyprenyl synthetase family protein [Defluviitaleaceae bacterium]
MYVEKLIELIDEAVLGYIEGARKPHTGDLYDAMEYAVLQGGKRVRPLILLNAFISSKNYDSDMTPAIPFAAAIEMLHAYSLVHDDLPALDNAATRRGKPTVHAQFGEATAILAGDALLNLAHEVMLKACMAQPGKRTISAAFAISNAAGHGGVIPGQAADIFYENKPAAPEVLHFIHKHKTAAFFSAAAYAGAVLAGEETEFAKKSALAFEHLGLAFQIKDDIGNITGDAATLGKPVGNDETSGKNTYVSVYGMEKTENDLKSLLSTGKQLLSELYEDGSPILLSTILTINKTQSV